MSHAFRDLLRKIGSGPHTSENLTRSESALATRMMLLQEATPAQIGAFMIAHRIKRPTGEELAGMLDAYDELGPRLAPIETAHPVMVLCSPYDGRDRTAPLSPLIALVLAAAGCPVVLHGGDRMPTKEGIPLIEVWKGLGVNWSPLSLDQVHQVLQHTGVGFVYLPRHFALAQNLVAYREEIGKRPPFATLELMWCPYGGDAHPVTGFVHPPTEGMLQGAFTLRGTRRFTTVKGLEGSCDLPRERTAIIGLGNPAVDPVESSDASSEPLSPFSFERLHLSPHDYGFAAKNIPLDSTLQLIADMKAVLSGQPSEFMQSVLWNGGFYLWRCGVCSTVEEGFATTRELLLSGKVLDKLNQLSQAVAVPQLTHQY